MTKPPVNTDRARRLVEQRDTALASLRDVIVKPGPNMGRIRELSARVRELNEQLGTD